MSFRDTLPLLFGDSLWPGKFLSSGYCQKWFADYLLEGFTDDLETQEYQQSFRKGEHFFLFFQMNFCKVKLAISMHFYQIGNFSPRLWCKRTSRLPSRLCRCFYSMRATQMFVFNCLATKLLTTKYSLDQSAHFHIFCLDP